MTTRRNDVSWCEFLPIKTQPINTVSRSGVGWVWCGLLWIMKGVFVGFFLKNKLILIKLFGHFMQNNFLKFQNSKIIRNYLIYSKFLGYFLPNKWKK